MKVAIVHYWFVTRRGGEKVVESLLKLFPQADIYTLFYDPNTYGNHLKDHNVYVSALGRIPFFRKHYQKIFPLYPIGIRSLRLKDDYDLIISSESGPAKGIKISDNTPHICYIHSPMRYCWGFTEEYLKSLPKVVRPLASLLFKELREWDRTTIDNVDLYIANSENVRKRVNKFYSRETEVIHPPIEKRLFEGDILKHQGDQYLSFGAITPYKRIDLLVDAFNKNGKKLVIIGDGTERVKLQSRAKSNITFTGILSWPEIESHIYKSRALVFPGEEDFGMIPLEVMAYGLPVIAYRKGGALETVVENSVDVSRSTGLFFDHQTIESLDTAIEKFESQAELFNSQWIRSHAFQFNEEIFLDKFKRTLSGFLAKT